MENIDPNSDLNNSTVQRAALYNVTNTVLSQDSNSLGDSHIRNTLKPSLSLAKKEGSRIPQFDKSRLLTTTKFIDNENTELRHITRRLTNSNNTNSTTTHDSNDKENQSINNSFTNISKTQDIATGSSASNGIPHITKTLSIIREEDLPHSHQIQIQPSQQHTLEQPNLNPDSNSNNTMLQSTKLLNNSSSNIKIPGENNNNNNNDNTGDTCDEDLNANSNGEISDPNTISDKENIPPTDINKKRPISAIVEQQLPKKFKSCAANGKEEYIWEDLDAEDGNDPFMVSEYVHDIFEYLSRLEVLTLPHKEDLYKHKNIRQNRDILVNWLVKIHNKFGLLPETLYLTINLLDRFLAKELVQLDRLQLVGTSCLFIASKYEEVYSPSIKHFASETDGACTEEEIKEGEKFILKTLEFNLNYPNPMNFLRRISKADDYDIQSRTLAKFLLEISLVDFRFIGILPSLCAAASMFLSRKMLGKGTWDGNLIHYSGGYTKEQLEPVCNMIMDYLVSPIVHDEFHKKYQSRRFMKASIISVQWALKVRKNGYNIMTLHE
ncbi:hypothetical protein TBLA_0E00540 [Henningerozyma blattae CBS 6284]|uniref:Uncharacterized protein n=1 Tax=Henningerozyma blattae (strain ATCC 34711 / CBS 6284 / DSM 70876 / NBRC 10599 / NRRL Y-10934 / UCD 77-7) TaxID=1071380 RepID=I2H413_HENB6|nr:hypothetical protein TBLA_0E00540 [Tetrapisispora blattae CBS 6284]CCH61115.1 hypothetical protein TBLA_0E00540 [Tetrapisispora blattae CBS 6284]